MAVAGTTRLLGLLVVLAGCASAVTTPPVPPVASSQPVASFGATASATLTSLPEASSPQDASPHPIATVRIPVADRAMDVRIVGPPGLLTSWRAATDAEVRTIDGRTENRIAIDVIDGRSIVVAWIGTVCDVQATLSVDTNRVVVTPAPRKGCDLVGVRRGLVLTYAASVDPATMTVSLGEPVLLAE